MATKSRIRTRAQKDRQNLLRRRAYAAQTSEQRRAHNDKRVALYRAADRPEKRAADRASAAIPAWARFWMERHRLACRLDRDAERVGEVRRRLEAAPEQRVHYGKLRRCGFGAGEALRELGL